MKSTLEEKMKYMRQEAEKEVVYYRNRMNEAVDERAGKFSFEFYHLYVYLTRFQTVSFHFVICLV